MGISTSRQTPQLLFNTSTLPPDRLIHPVLVHIVILCPSVLSQVTSPKSQVSQADLPYSQQYGSSGSLADDTISPSTVYYFDDSYLGQIRCNATSLAPDFKSHSSVTMQTANAKHANCRCHPASRRRLSSSNTT
ncbi:hypothetical protein Vi05172_g13394 [Venturia inaequalis]|nr:hypothetical protein Vi05172_g13394 [Venturia inaequalis]